jgi:mono/diheme cytochrome c family protein
MGWSVGGGRSTPARPLVAIASLVLLAFAPVALATDKGATPSASGIDYWQPDWMVRELWGPGHMPRGMMVRLLRHTTFMQYGVAKAYAGKRSTLVRGPETVAAGRKIYQASCASCHGPDGLGDGEAANALSPSPALLAYMIRRPIAVDEYLLWTISDGGAQFDTKMPAFKDKLSRDDIWRVVAYMRAGFPKDEGNSAEGKSDDGRSAPALSPKP